MFDLQGHRGARGLWPENTLAGFDGAVSLGVTSVELDVMLCADGVPVVTHDVRLNPDLVRRGGAWIAAPGRRVCDLAWAELQAFDVGRPRPGSTVASAFPEQAVVEGARIPSLRAVLALLRGRGVFADIELKAADDAPALVRAVLDAVDAENGIGFVRVRSFDFAALENLLAARPSVPLAWLTGKGVGPDVVPHGARRAWQPVWAPDHRGLCREDVEAAHARELVVKPWTVNAAPRARELRDWGVAGVCTDRPDLMQDLVIR